MVGGYFFPQMSILWANWGLLGMGPRVVPSHSGHPMEQPFENQKQAWPLEPVREPEKFHYEKGTMHPLLVWGLALVPTMAGSSGQ